MDEEVDPDDKNVNSILAQESSELFAILSSQSPTIIMKLSQMMPAGAGWNVTPSAEAQTEHIKAMLEYFKLASAAECCNFLQSMCMLCENIPMRLESRLISVAGDASNVCENSSPLETVKKFPSPPSEQQLVKRPRIDHWEQYIAAVMALLLRKWKRLSERLVGEVLLENVWVRPRTANRSRERPDQTPGLADRGSRTPEPDGDYGSLESRVTLETFLQGCAGKVTVIFGQSGSGKTLLMSALGQQWARRLGPVPSVSLFVLLEFRQLNLVSHPLSLSELLFRHYLPPKGGDEEKRAVVEYLHSNPEQSCWVLDGYDEFNSKLNRQEGQKEALDPETPLPVAELISGLLNRQLLPGCTVVVTCRARDVIDLEGTSDKVGQLLGWGCHDIKEYVHNFFGVEGHTANRGLGVQAADLLLSTQHLLAMSSLPALCNICCICLEHLLLEGQNADRVQVTEGGRGGGEGSRGRNQAQSGHQGGRRRGSEDMMDVTNVKAQLPLSQAQIPPIPSTLTQVYLTVLGAFLSRDPDKRRRKDITKTMTSEQSTVRLLRQYRPELRELSELAWKGLESSKILFMEDDISQDLLEFAISTGLLSQVELRREDGTLVNCYCFIHLTIQEFLAALRIMTSQDVSDLQLKKRFSLKTRWMTRSDQRTVFTDSLYLYVCGLASPHCTSALVQLYKTPAGTGSQNWVHKRQALVLKLLENLCHSTLTGPKILALCHCLQESQDHQLAQQVVGMRPTLELRNIQLFPNDIDALAFVVNSAGDNRIGLDFGACSMELECLDVLPSCQHIPSLSFRSRKYGDKLAEKLSSILPKFTNLRKLEFCGASLTASGAASLASALQNCPDITEINLSDNNLKDAGIEHIADVFNKLPRLNSVMLGRNNTSLNAVDYLIRKMSSCLSILRIHVDGTKELRVTFSQEWDLNSTHKPKSEPTVSLLNQNWTKPEMQKVAESLARCPALSVLDLSGGQWDVETLRTLTQFLPRFNVTKEIIMNESCSSVEDVVVLTALLSDCPAVMELHIRLHSPAQVSIVFSGGRENPAGERSKVLCLSFCDLLPADLGRVWRSLGASCDLTSLDLSNNRLGNKGLRKLLDLLPRLSGIQEINASNNGISMEGVLMLSGALCSLDNLTQIHISHGGKELVMLRFCPDKSDDNQQLKTLRINNSSFLPANINFLCRKLVHCRSNLELDLSRSSLTDEAFKNLLKTLPNMTSLRRLDVSYSILSTAAALTLVSCLSVSQRVASVELRLQTESLIHFDSVKVEHARCRLTNFNLQGENMERLLQILLQGPHLSDLDLSSNQLEDEAVKRFLDSLPELQISSYVNLSNNGLTQQGLLDVAGTLQTCGSVSGVEVSLGAEERCLIWFTQHQEKTLSIRESSLEREHLLRLAEICPCLTKLEFKNNQLTLDWIEDFVKQLKSSERGFSISIEELWIRAEKAVSLVCRCLELNRNIHTIKVHSTALHLSVMKSTELASDSDNSADVTASMATEKIGLVDCAATGYQLAPLTSIIHRCPLLTELDLSHNRLGLDGAEFLRSVLPSLPNLTSLSIASKETFVDHELSKMLLRATAIQRLNLSGHSIDDTAAQIIARMLPRLRSINLSHCAWPAAVGLQLIKALGECVGLESLWLNKIPTAVGQSGANSVLDLLAAMEGLTRVKEIELDGWCMADRGVEQLSRLLPAWTQLRKISLSKNLISDQSGDRLLEALGSCSHLEELHLSSNSLGDLTAARMALVLPSLTHITVLDISENRIGYEGSLSLSKAIKCMKNLTKIHLTSVGLPELSLELCGVAASLAHCPLIQDVSLGWNNCGDSVAVELARVMPVCQKLTRIDLESNRVSACGAEALLRALQSCPALQVIRLWRNQVSPTDAHKLSLRDRRLNFSST